MIFQLLFIISADLPIGTNLQPAVLVASVTSSFGTFELPEELDVEFIFELEELEELEEGKTSPPPLDDVPLEVVPLDVVPLEDELPEVELLLVFPLELFPEPLLVDVVIPPDEVEPLEELELPLEELQFGPVKLLPQFEPLLVITEEPEDGTNGP